MTLQLVRLLLLLLGSLVGVSVQQCTIERIEAIAANTTETTLQIQDVSINRISYNCLSPSPTINGTYTSMSVSMLYTSSNSPNQSRGIRYNVKCEDDRWSVVDSDTAGISVMIDNVTRVDCASCLDQTVNDDHCTRKYLFILPRVNNS